MQYPFTIGLVMNDNLTSQTKAYPGGTFSFGIFHKKYGVGIRYRKDVWYDFSRCQERGARLFGVQKDTSIAYHEENYIEMYKTFRFKSANPNRSPQFTVGGGYGQIYPYFETRAARVMSVFASVPIHWFTLEVRARPFLHDPHQHSKGLPWEVGNPKYQWFSFSLQTSFPRKYYEK